MTGYIGMEWYGGIKSQEVLEMIANSEQIEVRVGVEANRKTWHVPKKLLTNSSTFFAAALDGGFAEQHSKTVILPEVVVDDFEVWIQWLYLGELVSKEYDKLVRDYQKELVRLWSLGDMLGCPIFQDVSLALLVADMNNEDPGMRPESLAFVWETCAHGSKLRKVVVDQLANDVRLRRFKEYPEIGKAYAQFAEDNEDFAREYTAASIKDGGREELRQTIHENDSPSP